MAEEEPAADSSREPPEDKSSEVIAHFQEVTGIDDEDRCRQILERHAWIIEAAVQDTLNEAEGSAPVFDQPLPPVHPQDGLRYRQPHPQHQIPVVRPFISPPRLVRPQPPMGWGQWLYSLFITLPIRFIQTVIQEAYLFIVGLFGQPPADPRDPMGDVLNFIGQFDINYGNRHVLFQPMPYRQIMDKARDEVKLVLAYLHSERHRDTDEFCRSILCNDLLIQFVERSNCLCWGVSVNSAEGAAVSYALRERSYPFLCLIAPRSSRIVVITRVEGLRPCDELVNHLQQTVLLIEPELLVIRNQRIERQQAQLLRQQQDQEYLDSLHRDQEKEKKRQNELDQLQRQSEEEEMKMVAEKEREQELARERTKVLDSLPLEPPEGDSNSCKIVFRLPNGSRLERRFHRTDKLKVLYDFVLTHQDSWSHFELITNYPRRVLQVDEQDGGPPLGDLSLGTNCILYVQDQTD